MRHMRGMRAAGLLVAGMVVLSGCTSSTGAEPSTIVTGTSTVINTLPPTGPPPSPSTVTITQTPTSAPTTGSTTRAPAPPETLPAQEPGDCPYLTNAEASIANGQGLGQTMIRPTKPYVVCDFYRSDGGWSASVRVAVTKDESAAVALVDHAAPTTRSNPATLDDGWSGGYWIKELGADPLVFNEEELAIYAVSKGKVAVIASSNESESKKAKNFVVAAIANLDL